MDQNGPQDKNEELTNKSDFIQKKKFNSYLSMLNRGDLDFEKIRINLII